jgi:hypothetical protein
MLSALFPLSIFIVHTETVQVTVQTPAIPAVYDSWLDWRDSADRLDEESAA